MLAADELEPLELADGTKIDPVSGSVIKDKKASHFIEVPSNSVAQAIVTKSRKSLNDLPAPPQELTAVALVAFYTLFGLSDQDIALAVDSRLTVAQVSRVRALDAYLEFMESAKTNIIESSTDVVREVFQQNAFGAAQKVVALADSENDVLAFKASQDILDRAGHRPADIVEHRHKMEDALNIVITHKDENQQAPVIDLHPEKVKLDENL